MPHNLNPLPQLIPQRVIRMKGEIDALLWERTHPLSVDAGPVNLEPIGWRAAQRQRLQPVQAGEFFGPPRGGWHQRWFRVRVPPASGGERGRRFLGWDCQGETTVYHGGTPWAGLDIAHPTCPLPNQATTLWLDCSTWQTGIWLPGMSPAAHQVGPYGLRFDACSLRIRNPLAWCASWDLDVLIRLMNCLLEQEDLRSPGMFGHLRPL